MRYPGNVVSAEDTRARGYGVPTKCFYCDGVPGGPHDGTCVCLERPVKIKLTLDLVIAVPRAWTKEQAEFRWNESTYCMDNILDHVERHKEVLGCLCSVAKIEYIGEATQAEAEEMGLKPDTED